MTPLQPEYFDRLHFSFLFTWRYFISRTDTEQVYHRVLSVFYNTKNYFNLFTVSIRKCNIIFGGIHFVLKFEFVTIYLLC